MDADLTATHDSAVTTTKRAGNLVERVRASRDQVTGGQLHLHIGEGSGQPDWRLDEATRALGRRGIAQARAALRSARADHLDRNPDEQPGRGVASSRRPTAA